MKFDANALAALAAMNDDALWAQIRTIAATAGISLAAQTPPHADLERLRGMIRGAGEADLAGAMQLLARFRAEGGR